MTKTTDSPILTVETLRQATQLAELIEKTQGELNALLAGKALSTSKKGGKRQLSPKAIAAIRRGQARRWEKVRSGAAASEPTPVTAPVAS